MQNKKVAIGIVTFNPNIRQFGKNIQILKESKLPMIIVDNYSSNRNDILRILSNVSKVEIIMQEENYGIATGLNRIMKQAEELGFSWVLTLDQDSECDIGMVKKMYQYIGNDDSVAIYTSHFIERNSKKNITYISSMEEVKTCITAGTITNVQIWKKVGKYDEKLFIDLIDIIFCAKILHAGYKIIRINDAKFIQEIGNDYKEIKILNHYIPIRNHDSKRYYYYARNSVYFLKNFKGFPLKKEVSWGLFVWVMKVILFEEKKKIKLQEMYRGCRDGKRGVWE